eukprot:1893009-Rhodomonas_salina.1
MGLLPAGTNSVVRGYYQLVLTRSYGATTSAALTQFTLGRLLLDCGEVRQVKATTKRYVALTS